MWGGMYCWAVTSWYSGRSSVLIGVINKSFHYRVFDVFGYFSK